MMSEQNVQTHSKYVSRITPQDVTNHLYKTIFKLMHNENHSKDLVGMSQLQTKLKDWFVTRKEAVTDVHPFTFLKEYGFDLLQLTFPSSMLAIVNCVTKCVKDYIGIKLLPRNDNYLKRQFKNKSYVIYKNSQ